MLGEPRKMAICKIYQSLSLCALPCVLWVYIVRIDEPYWYEEHVCDGMIQTQTHKQDHWSPQANDLGYQLPPLCGREHSKTHQPICSNTPQKDLVPCRYDNLIRCEREDCGPVGLVVKYATVAEHQRHREQRASDISEKRDG